MTLPNFLRFWDCMNFVAAGLACFYNVRAARRSFLDAKPRLYTTATLAGLYVVAYGILIFTNIPLETWSNSIRGFGVISWGVVWIWPARSVQRASRIADERLTSRDEYDEPPG